jgi:hypothetical protein
MKGRIHLRYCYGGRRRRRGEREKGRKGEWEIYGTARPQDCKTAGHLEQNFYLKFKFLFVFIYYTVVC